MAAEADQPHSLEEVLDRLTKAEADRDKVSLEAILDTVGRRSFGPLLLVAGLVTISPIGDIPSVPTMMAILVGLVSVQLLFHRDAFWLPQWLLRRSVSRGKLHKSIDWTRKPARWIDKLLRRRMTVLTEGKGAYVIALAVLLIAIATPPLELIPGSGTAAGAALMGFGLALIAHDGLLALIAAVFTAVTFALAAYNLI